MATTKKSAVKSPKTTSSPKPVRQKSAATSGSVTAKSIKEKNYDELVADNFAALSTVVVSFGTTLEMLVHKTESMANHIIATEEILAEIVATNGLNLAHVNARIREKIAIGTDNKGNANQAIDVAALIASPLPRRKPGVY
jgi:hypothetical protein